MPQFLEFSQSGRLLEAFGAGTAAIIAPVASIGYEGRDIVLPVYEGGAGPVAKAMYNVLVAIQEGRVECEGWSVRCDA
jgi:branched-chain amino acid aminotransferase